MTDNASQFIGEIPVNYDTRLGPNIFVDYAKDIAERAGALTPQSALELAAGTGIVSHRLHKALPPGAELTVTDLNAPMLDIAKAKFDDTTNVAFTTADAMSLPFDDNSFDLVVCQFGVMFFPDKVDSYREVLRVLKPGGTYVFNTWGTLDENQFARIAFDVAKGFFPSDPPGFYQVPFSYADEDVVLAESKAAGFVTATAEAMPIRKEITEPLEFAKGQVFGNPLADEIQARGGVDPNDVVAAIHDAQRQSFGENPAMMDLKATVFTCKAPA